MLVCIHFYSPHTLCINSGPDPIVPIGRVSQYSSLRRHRPKEYDIQDASFCAQDAQVSILCLIFANFHFL